MPKQTKLMLLCLGPAAGLDRLVAAKLLISVSSGRARGPWRDSFSA